MDKNTKTVLIVIGIIIAIFVIVPSAIGAIFGWQGGNWGMMGSSILGGFGWMMFMPFLWIVFLGLIIWAVIALVRGLGVQSGGSGSSAQSESALETLRKRYARGEIDKQEFEEKKKDLE